MTSRERNNDPTVLYVDVAGSTSLATYNRPELVVLTQQMVELFAGDTQQFTVWGDNALAVFATAEEAYEHAKELAIWWREYPAEVESLPSGVGLRVGLEVGPVLSSGARGPTFIGPTVNMAAALGFQASVDSLLLGPRAHK